MKRIRPRRIYTIDDHYKSTRRLLRVFCALNFLTANLITRVLPSYTQPGFDRFCLLAAAFYGLLSLFNPNAIRRHPKEVTSKRQLHDLCLPEYVVLVLSIALIALTAYLRSHPPRIGAIRLEAHSPWPTLGFAALFLAAEAGTFLFFWRKGLRQLGKSR